MIAFVPLRAPGSGKTRLGPRLSPVERAELAAAMLSDVIAALRTSSVDRVVAVTSGAQAAAAASDLDVEVAPQPLGVRGLDAALSHATRGHDRADRLVVMADLPALGPDDIDAVLAADADVVVAATADGGTGALLRRRGVELTTAYGPGSARRHLAAARAMGWRAARIDRPGFAVDVDVYGDLTGLRQAVVGPATGAVLRRRRDADSPAG